jgi:trimeric autotransporter adhesin
MTTDFLKLLQEVRGTGAPEAAYTDGIWWDLTVKDYNGNTGMYSDIQATYASSVVLNDNSSASAIAAAASEASALSSFNSAALAETSALASSASALASASSATTDAALALASKDSATASALSATASENSATASESSASTSATTATTKSNEASASASAASIDADNANASKLSASTSATEASASASSAASSAGNANTSSTAALVAKTASEAAAGQSSLSATEAWVSEANAETSSLAAYANQVASEASEANSAASASAALVSENAAKISEDAAKVSEDNSFTYQQNAKYSEVFVGNLVMGDFAIDPLVNNTNGVLVVGAIYYNTTYEETRIWNGVTWEIGTFDTTGIVNTFNTRNGNVILLKADIDAALGYTAIEYSQAEKDKLAAIEDNVQVNTVDSVAGKTGVVTLVKSDVGLANVDNTSDASKPVSTATQTALDLKEDKLNKGTANGYAELDASGLVPSGQLPSYVDDVLEFANLAALPATGEASKIYVTLDTNLTYRWAGTVYADLSSGVVLGETSTTAYRGDRGKIAYDHSQTTHDKALVGLDQVDNTSDANKPISSATQTALDAKVDDGQVLTDVPAGAVFTDTTYSIQDGELSEISFTSADNTKLDGIEALATADQTAVEISTLTKDYTETLTNKTIADITNKVHANAVHFAVQATENLLRGDTLVVVGVIDDTTVKVAKRSSVSQPIIGIAGEDIGNGIQGLAVSVGILENLTNAGSWDVGDILYPDAVGGLTTTVTVDAVGYRQPVAYVVKATAPKVSAVINVHSGHESANLIGYDNTLGSVVTTTNLQDGIAELDVSATAHLADNANPHSVTSTQVGLGNVDNTTDAAKPVSAATQTALDLKADLVSPSLTGSPTAPTATLGSSTTELATTAFVANAIGASEAGSVSTATAFTASGFTKRIPKATRFLEGDTPNVITDSVSEPIYVGGTLVERTANSTITSQLAPFDPLSTDELLDDAINGVTTQTDHSKGDIVVTGNELSNSGESVTLDYLGYIPSASAPSGYLAKFNCNTSSYSSLDTFGSVLSTIVERWVVIGGYAFPCTYLFKANSTNYQFYCDKGLLTSLSITGRTTTGIFSTHSSINNSMNYILQATTSTTSGDLLTDTSKFQVLDRVTRQDVILIDENGRYLTVKGTNTFEPRAYGDVIAAAYGWSKL